MYLHSRPTGKLWMFKNKGLSKIFERKVRGDKKVKEQHNENSQFLGTTKN